MDVVDNLLGLLSKEVPIRRHLIEQAIVFIAKTEDSFRSSRITSRSAAKQAKLSTIKTMLTRLIAEEEKDIEELKEIANEGEDPNVEG